MLNHDSRLTPEELAAIEASPGLGALRRVMRNNVRRARNGFIVLVVFVLVAFGFVQRVNADARHRALVTLCESGNDYRTNDLAGWIKLAQLIGPYPPAPGSKAAEFLLYETHKDTLRDCSKL